MRERITTKEVLQVVGVAAIVVSSLVIPSLPMAVASSYKQWKKVNKSQLGLIIKRMQRQELITVREDRSKTILEITNKGKKRLLEYQIEEISLHSTRRDGQLRLVLFDIPEHKKNARDLFRRKLRQMGLVRIQDSVWVSAYPCKDEIDFLCHYLEISNFVSVIKINSFERGKELFFQV